MKNRTASYIFVILSVLFTGYFIALEIASPAFFSFCFIWLFAGIIFFLFFLHTRSKNSDACFVLPGQIKLRTKRILAAAAAVFVFIAAVNVFFICTPVVSDGTEQVQYVILLGGGITQKGTLPPGSERRVQKTAEYMKQHPLVKAVVSGGKGPFAPCAESKALFLGLVRCGISADRIIQEDTARDTIENFSYSAPLMAQDAGISKKEALLRPVAVVTSDYHLARAERIACRQGYAAVYGIAAETPPLFIVNSYAREILAYIKLNMRILITQKPARLY